MDDKTYLWEHFKLHADQRIKTFNFYVVFAIFTDGAVYTVIDRGLHDSLLIILGIFIISLSIIFRIIDTRSRNLIDIAISGLKKLEENSPEYAKPFSIDSTKRKGAASYTCAFNLLFGLQVIFGLGLIVYTLVSC